MASSPQKNLQFISPPKEAGDFLQNQVKVWTADEKNIQTTLTEAQVEAQFDTLVLSGDSIPTLAQRVAALEDAISALADALASTES